MRDSVPGSPSGYGRGLQIRLREFDSHPRLILGLLARNGLSDPKNCIENEMTLLSGKKLCITNILYYGPEKLEC